MRGVVHIVLWVLLTICAWLFTLNLEYRLFSGSIRAPLKWHECNGILRAAYGAQQYDDWVAVCKTLRLREHEI